MSRALFVAGMRSRLVCAMEIFTFPLQPGAQRLDTATVRHQQMMRATQTLGEGRFSPGAKRPS